MELEAQEVRDEANAWLARFAPLVMPDAALSITGAEKQLATAQTLRAEADELVARLGALSAPHDIELSDTVTSAVSHLPALESELRARLSGNQIDLDKLQARLAEREAKQELGLPTGYQNPAILQLMTSPRNVVAAGGIGVFALGWNAFTLFHATLMIGGMYKAFGPVALFMLLFYSIFFGAGFFMAYATIDALSEETIDLQGHTLTVRKSLGKWIRTKTIELDPQTQAVVGTASMGFSNSNNKKPQRAILMTDSKGKEVSIGVGATEELKH
ncbi:MAG TPA: hypothetical protein VK171_10585, partial [Fimbriimonas sp.]|nr:hypothetical protein [Fimbriimonas sp.]